MLPFVNAGGDPNAEYLSDGITESLINNVSQIPGIKVVSRGSAFHYKGKDVDAERSGESLALPRCSQGESSNGDCSLDSRGVGGRPR